MFGEGVIRRAQIINIVTAAVINSSSGTAWSIAREEGREIPARQPFLSSRSCSRCLKRELK